MSGVRALQVPGGGLVRPVPALQEHQPILLPGVHQGAGHRAQAAAQAVQVPRLCR